MPDKIVIDACVLYPTVMRAVVLGAARAGLFHPIWSARLLEEWARAAARYGATQETQARTEIALLRHQWPQSEHRHDPGLEARLWLPDDNDIHVLATAVSSHSDTIMTLNAKDFPKGILAEEGLARVDPDSYLMTHWAAHETTLREVCRDIQTEAERLSGQAWPIRSLLKKARLPRLAKAVSAARDP